MATFVKGNTEYRTCKLCGARKPISQTVKKSTTVAKHWYCIEHLPKTTRGYVSKPRETYGPKPKKHLWEPPKPL